MFTLKAKLGPKLSEKMFSSWLSMFIYADNLRSNGYIASYNDKLELYENDQLLASFSWDTGWLYHKT